MLAGTKKRRISVTVRPGYGKSCGDSERYWFYYSPSGEPDLSLERILSGSNLEGFFLLRGVQTSAERIQGKKDRLYHGGRQKGVADGYF